MSIGKTLTRLTSTIARFRDAVRTFRGRRPKYSHLARYFVSDDQLAQLHSPRLGRGICTADDLKLGTLSAEESSLLKATLESTRECPGPIIQFGTLLGETASSFCLWKARAQTVFAIDPAAANPWNLPSAAYRALVARTLNYLLKTGQVVHLTTRPRDFFQIHRQTVPALVYLNYVRSYKEARQIIRWAKTTGAHAVVGRGYDFTNPHIVQAVDEAGGPEVIEGNVWRLNLGSHSSAFASNEPTSYVPLDGGESVTDLVSVVIPAYNAREFIDLALDDISRQLYRNWELIVVEDGSVEDVAAAIECFRSRHPQHRVVYHAKPTNTGVSSTRNHAMSLCRGEFIAFLDADDRWAPDHLQRKVRLLRQSGCDLVHSRVDAFDSATGKTLCIWGATADELKNFPQSMYRRPFLQPSGVVARQSLVADVGSFDEQLAFAEDYDYWFKAVSAGKRFCFDEKVTSRYRKNHESAATTDRIVKCYDGIAKVARRHLSASGVDDPSLRQIVAKHFLAAGTGHLAFPPTSRNGCDPAAGEQCLLESWQLNGKRWSRIGYYLLARFMLATHTAVIFRGIFRRRYDRCLRTA